MWLYQVERRYRKEEWLGDWGEEWLNILHIAGELKEVGSWMCVCESVREAWAGGRVEKRCREGGWVGW